MHFFLNHILQQKKFSFLKEMIKRFKQEEIQICHDIIRYLTTKLGRTFKNLSVTALWNNKSLIVFFCKKTDVVPSER